MEPVWKFYFEIKKAKSLGIFLTSLWKPGLFKLWSPGVVGQQSSIMVGWGGGAGIFTQEYINKNLSVITFGKYSNYLYNFKYLKK